MAKVLSLLALALFVMTSSATAQGHNQNCPWNSRCVQVVAPGYPIPRGYGNQQSRRPVPRGHFVIMERENTFIYAGSPRRKYRHRRQAASHHVSCNPCPEFYVRSPLAGNACMCRRVR